MLVIDKIPEMKEMSVNSSVIAVHKPSMEEWYRSGNVTGTNERLSLVHVRYVRGPEIGSAQPTPVGEKTYILCG